MENFALAKAQDRISELDARITHLELVIKAAFEALESNNEADAFQVLKHAAKPKPAVPHTS
jgi:hypothetical protein